MNLRGDILAAYDEGGDAEDMDEETRMEVENIIDLMRKNKENWDEEMGVAE